MINEDEEIYETVVCDFIQRIQPQLRKFLKDPVNMDFHCALLKFVDEIMKNQNDEAIKQLSRHYKDFKLLTSDRTEVCLIKCEILQKLYAKNDEEMKSNIFKYLLNQLEQNPSYEIKTAILKSLCQMKEPTLSSDLLQLLRTNPEEILPILVKNARVIPNDLENKGEVLREMCLYWLAYMEHGHSDDNGNNIIWTLCHHGHVIKDSVYILEKLMNMLPEESLKTNLDLLLLSGVKVFLQSPAETQHILGRIFHLCHQQAGTAEDISEKLVFYSKLLHKYPEHCQKTLILSPNK